MRRFMAFLLLISMFLLPVFVSCVPSGYEEGSVNPNKPPEYNPNGTAPAPPPADDSSSSDDTSSSDDSGQ
jgi:hypothetical protein